jgi:hypothetical protein
MLIKVRFKKNVERFPHFIVKAGMTGELIEMSLTQGAVKLDVPLSGAENFDYTVWWEDEEIRQMNDELEIINSNLRFA